MLRLLVLAFLAAACLGHPLDFPDGKIVGGDPVDIKDYPYQLSLEIGGSHSCGASIISANWAVTAAHCSGGSASSMKLRAGSSKRGSGGTLHTVAQKIVNSQYNSAKTDYDIALLRVDSPFIMGPGVGIIGLPAQDETVATGADSIVSGWGTLSSGGSLPSQLQAVHVPVVSQSECQSAYGSSAITNRMICAGLPSGGKDSCQGDSGGPMVAGNKLIGIVSWGRGCALAGYPGVYGRVASMRDWIKTNSGI